MFFRKYIYSVDNLIKWLLLIVSYDMNVPLLCVWVLFGPFSRPWTMFVIDCFTQFVCWVKPSIYKEFNLNLSIQLVNFFGTCSYSMVDFENAFLIWKPYQNLQFTGKEYCASIACRRFVSDCGNIMGIPWTQGVDCGGQFLKEFHTKMHCF